LRPSPRCARRQRRGRSATPKLSSKHLSSRSQVKRVERQAAWDRSTPYFDGPLSRADCLSVLAWGPATWRVWLTRSWVSTSPSTSPTHQVRARSGTFTPLSLARARGAGLLCPSSDSLNLTLPAFPSRATEANVVRSLWSILAPRIGEFYWVPGPLSAGTCTPPAEDSLMAKILMNDAGRLIIQP